MNVLSLFDGISCGRQALQDAEIPVKSYFASEIEKAAIRISKRNWPEIVHLGDVKNWKTWDLPKIDLVMGGSPCQGFSRCGVQKNFKDERSVLFFDFLKIFETLEPKYFLYENVVMRPLWAEIISDFLGAEPVMIDSKNFVPQNRKRLYWTNIPFAEIPQEKHTLSEILLDRAQCEDITERMHKKVSGTEAHKKAFASVRTYGQVAKCLTKSGQKIANTGATNFCINERYYLPHPIECERLQGLPDNYTEGESKTARYGSLGNGWTVPVIAHILKGMK